MKETKVKETKVKETKVKTDPGTKNQMLQAPMSKWKYLALSLR